MSALTNSIPDFDGAGRCGSAAETGEARESAVQTAVNE
jgi:hypothetical protein